MIGFGDERGFAYIEVVPGVSSSRVQKQSTETFRQQGNPTAQGFPDQLSMSSRWAGNVVSLVCQQDIPIMKTSSDH